MKKKVILLKRVQGSMTGENLILMRELANEFEGNGNIGVPYICKDDEVEILDESDIIDVLPKVDGYETPYAVRITMTIEQISQSDFFNDAEK